VWPDWLAARLKSALGEERAEAMAELQLEEPPIDLTLKAGCDPAEWAEKLGGGALANGTVRLKAGVRLMDMPGYAEGAWWVQDAAASLPATLMGDVRGRRIADLCAAPGGKSLQLASMGAELTAIDISKQRIEVLKENATRTGLAMKLVEEDARAWRPEAPLDAVLLDAPCSALGIMRRHPEGVWKRDPKDLVRFPSVQRGLVDAAGAMLKPGGRLVYCVCTPSPEEGQDVVDAAVAAGDWRRVKISPEEVRGFSFALTTNGDLITAPAKRDSKNAASGETAAEPIKSDIFYIARLERLDGSHH
jgi:16S rRNA (cytosine967-C5)-methyltransferase